MKVMIEISPGELLDRITILQIKKERIAEPAKLRNIEIELNLLLSRYDALHCTLNDDQMAELLLISDDMKMVNEEIWDYEDTVRGCELEKQFTEGFIVAARGIYKANDKRSRLKRQINDMLNSKIVEEKSYAAYE